MCILNQTKLWKQIKGFLKRIQLQDERFTLNGVCVTRTFLTSRCCHCKSFCVKCVLVFARSTSCSPPALWSLLSHFTTE